MAKYVYRVDKRPLTIEEKRAFAQFVNEQHDEEIGQLDIDAFAKLELYDETVTFKCSYCHEKIVVDFDVVRKNCPKIRIYFLLLDVNSATKEQCCQKK